MRAATAGRARRELRLGIENGRLVGKLGGETRCTGEQMLGMSFAITVQKCVGDTPCVASVRIAAQGSISTWNKPPADVPTYRLVWSKLPDPWPPGLDGPQVHVGDSVCPRREAWMEPWQQGNKPPEPDPWHDATDHLIVVQGETYTRDAVIDRAHSGARWFDVACVGTALAKMRLLGYDPMRNTTQVDESLAGERQATLKMLTGRYRGETSYTSAGMPLMWEHRDHRELAGTPAGGWSRARLESYWNKDGATCLSHRRTWRQPDPLSVPPGTLDPAATLRAQIAATMSKAMPEADPPPTLTMPTGCLSLVAQPGSGSKIDVCIRALETAYAARERSSVTGAYGNQPCPPASSDHVWITYPVDHVVH